MIKDVHKENTLSVYPSSCIIKLILICCMSILMLILCNCWYGTWCWGGICTYFIMSSHMYKSKMHMIPIIYIASNSLFLFINCSSICLFSWSSFSIFALYNWDFLDKIPLHKEYHFTYNSCKLYFIATLTYSC